jgi:putative transcriptional regulator
MENDMFEELVESVREGMAIMRGEKKPSRSFHFEPNDVQTIRRKFGFSQSEFASLMGISINTLQNWEQGRRKPTGSAKILLRIAEKNPEVLLNATNNALV